MISHCCNQGQSHHQQSHRMTNNSCNCRLSLCCLSSGQGLERYVLARLDLQDMNWEHLLVSGKYSCMWDPSWGVSTQIFAPGWMQDVPFPAISMNENAMAVKSDATVLKKTEFFVNLKPLTSSGLCPLPLAEDSAAETTPTHTAGLHPSVVWQGWVCVFV